MEENQQYAIWKVHSPELFHGGEVQELMKNGRAMLKSENKKGPVVYYHRLCSLKEGREIMAALKIVKLHCDEEQLASYEKYVRSVETIINKTKDDSKF